MGESDVYMRLAGKVNFPKSRYIRQVFRKLVTPEEGEMLLALPASHSDLAERFQMDEATVNKKLDEFVRKGVALPLEKGGVLRHFCVAHIIQFHDASIHATINKKYEPVQDEIVELWQQFRETEWFEVLREREESRTGRVRVIPVRSAIKDETQLIPYEDLETILKDAPAIGVGDCPCRWLRVNQGKCDKPTFVCLSLTAGAVKYIVDRGIGRKISVEEACEILDICEEAGLIPTTGGGAQVRNLCFCCTDCCIELRAVVSYGYDLVEKSRYQAVVDEGLCNGCQICVDRCQFGAIAMKKEPPSKKYKAVVDPEKCYGCGLCVVKCPTEALSMKLVRPVEHIPLAAGQY
jgi:ferredoxin